MRSDNKAAKFSKKVLLRHLFGIIRPYRKQFLVLVSLFMLLALVAPLTPILVEMTIDEYVLNGNYGGLLKMTLLMAGLLPVHALLQFANTYLSGWITHSIIHDVRMAVYRHLLNQQQAFHDRSRVGRLVTHTTSDVEMLASLFSEGIAATPANALQVLVVLGIMCWTNWQLTLASLMLLPVLVISTYVYHRKARTLYNDIPDASANLNTFVQEHISGMSIVQLFGAEQAESRKFEQLNRAYMRAHVRSLYLYWLYAFVTGIVQAASTGLMVWYGAWAVLQGEATLGTLVAFIMYSSMLFRPIQRFIDNFEMLQLGFSGLERIIKLLTNTEHIATGGSYSPARIRGDIAFRGVWFAYNDEDYRLRDINLEIKSGETVALVGATGAGKSSVINLLGRFYDINRGQITLDGVDLRQYELGALRRRMAVVLQDVFLFSDSIFNNITLLDPSISRGEVIAAARLMGADCFIERLPGGYDYQVMERGATLSAGQRQLISFVRALVHNPDIIVLDEATACVDTETEALMQEAFEKLVQGRTVVMIAHRLSTIRKASKIVVIDQGQIREQGTHAELLAGNGPYAELHRVQYKEGAGAAAVVTFPA
jgi:ATP-binding cassette subfamily B protein